MSDVNLSMSVEEINGNLTGRICVEQGNKAREIQIFANRDGTFDHSAISSALGYFARAINEKFDEPKKEAA